MKTESVSREEFEKWAYDKSEYVGAIERDGESYLHERASNAWEAYRAGWQAASRQAPQEYEIMDTSSMKREPAEGKQAEPPSQPEQDHIIWTLRQCLRFIRDESSSISEHDASDMEATVENLICRLAESPSQASKL